jgi:hypothetical protein
MRQTMRNSGKKKPLRPGGRRGDEDSNELGGAVGRRD